jgi:hypothetical protein
VRLGLLAYEYASDDVLGNGQHIWNTKKQNLSHFFLVCLLSSKSRLILNKTKGILDHSNGISTWSLCDQDIRPVPIP